MDPINVGGKEERKLLEGSRAVGSPKQLLDSFPIERHCDVVGDSERIPSPATHHGRRFPLFWHRVLMPDSQFEFLLLYLAFLG